MGKHVPADEMFRFCTINQLEGVVKKHMASTNK